MNTNEIVSLLGNHEITKSNFVGCFPVDRLPVIDILKYPEFSLVVNLDVSTGPGTHWCGVYFKNRKMYYFDSFGRKPTKKLLRKWFSNYVNVVYFNNIKHQKKTSLRCGGFCCWFIHEMASGEPFYSTVIFLDKIRNDDDFIKIFMKKNFDYEIL